MATPNKLGRITSAVARYTVFKRSFSGWIRPLCCACARRRTAFSTIITVPSTIKPKSSAPRLIRLAETPACTMPVMVISIDSGITAAVINAARRLPSRINNTTITSNAPSSRFLLTVAMALSTKVVRSYTASAIIPSGRELLICSSFCATSRATVREFSPINIMAVPSTASLPSWVAAPVRSSLPMATSATSLSFTGMVSYCVIMTLAMSSREVN